VPLLGSQMDKINQNEDAVIPVLAEELEILKRQVETGGGVRVHKTVTEREQVVDEPLVIESAEVTRVPVNKVVESAPPVRHVGDTMIMSVVEEQLFIEKRLVLKEEIHVRKSREHVRHPQAVTLREEHVEVERFGQHVEDVTEQPRGTASGSVLDRVFPPSKKHT